MQRMAASMGGPGAMPPGAADQFKNMSADDLKRASEELKDMDPETLKSTMNAAQSQMQGQQDYVMRGAEQLKRDGNKLVGEEKFTDAIEKYMRVKNNLQDIQTPAARALRTSCMLNMSLCFNKTKRYNSAVSECTEVLLGDGRSLKAYYRRGQAHYAKGELARAVKDLRRAVKLAPGDETVAAECAKAESDMKEKGVVDEDDGACPAFEGPDPSSEPPATANPGGSGSFPGMPPGTSQAQMDQAMKMMKDPAAMSKAAEMMENMSEEQLEEMQKMAGASMPGAPKLDPGMAKQAAAMMKNMDPEAMSGMMEMAAKMREGGGMPGGGPSLGPDGQPTPEMMAAMTEQMKDPKMQEAMSSMMKNITPEQLKEMTKASGINMTDEQAEQTAKVMQSISPETMARMMKVGSFFQWTFARFRRTYQARSIHWSSYDRVRVVNADP